MALDLITCFIKGADMRALLLLSIWLAATVSAAPSDDSKNTMYRFKNAQGVWEMTHVLTPEAYQAGYQVVEGGQVIETVLPPPTEAQLKERVIAEELVRQQKEQDFKDQQLLKTYSSVGDAERARDRKISQMKVMTEITQARIQQMKTDNEKLVADAANAQQLGLSVYDTIVNKLRINEQEVSRLQTFIDGKNQEKQRIIAEHQVIIDRLDYLLNSTEQKAITPGAAPAPQASATTATTEDASAASPADAATVAPGNTQVP